MILNERVNLVKYSYLVCFVGVVVFCYYLFFFFVEVGVYLGVDFVFFFVCFLDVF